MNDIGSFNGLSEDESLSFSEIGPRINSDGCSPIRFIPVPDFNKTLFASTLETTPWPEDSRVTSVVNESLNFHTALESISTTVSADGTSTDEVNEFESLKDSVTPSGCYGTIFRML